MEQVTNKSADNIRVLSAAMVEKAKSGHPGGAMGGADFINILYAEFLNFDPDDGEWMMRDRFFLDPGHMSPMLYSILALSGFYSLDDLMNFRQWGSCTPGHPEKDFKRGVENTSGPLGVGHTMAVGSAIAERFMCARFGEELAHKTYTFISDGGVQEEISQGAGRIAGHLGLSNLIMFYDSNDIQLSTKTSSVSSEDTAKKYDAWGWNVLTIHGNDAKEIREALTKANAETEKPTLIIGRTLMGKGALDASGNSYEGKTETHGMPLSAAGASFGLSIENMGGDSSNPFQFFPEVEEYWKDIRKQKTQYANNINAQQAKWREGNPKLAEKLAQFYEADFSNIDFSAIAQKANNSTRGASGIVLSYLAENTENIIVSSADLSNSDKTDGYLSKTKAFEKGDFTGKFLQSGVSELTMAAMANGMALHGGVIPVCGTFFVFSDYMKPAVRLAALMELPVKYVWTHDAFRVGEDGPTHQPVEQEAQIRLMEHLKNHSGKNSVLVLRPADADETTVSWEMALKNNATPTALILSRQNIQSLPGKDGKNAYDKACEAKRGGYVAYKTKGETEMVFVANGSEVSTMIGAADLVYSKLGIGVQVASIMSEGLFRNQDADYQELVLPQEKKYIGLTAGLPVTLQGLVGPGGKIFGLESFGFSAPAGVLDEKLGYTPELLFENVKSFIDKA